MFELNLQLECSTIIGVPTIPKARGTRMPWYEDRDSSVPKVASRTVTSSNELENAWSNKAIQIQILIGPGEV